MLRNNRTALICDLAETYGILDCRAVPTRTLAALAAGLREDSRSKMQLAGRNTTGQEMMLAAILDGVNRAVWLLSAICPQEGEKPKSVLRILTGEETAEDQEAVTFDTAEEFEQAWKNRTGR